MKILRVALKVMVLVAILGAVAGVVALISKRSSTPVTTENWPDVPAREVA